LNSLGYIYVEQGYDLDEAIVLIKKALEIDPENGAYIDSLGWAYFKKGMIEEALVELERAINVLPDPEIYDHLGEVYYKMGDNKKAQENWQKSVELRDDPTVKEKLNKLQPEKKEN